MKDSLDERGVRELLDAAVADVEPRRGIDEIRERTRPGRRGSWVWGTAGAVVVTAATIAAVALTAGLPGASPNGPGPAGSTSERTASPWVVTVYYVGDTGAGPRLFRESRFGPPSAGGDKFRDAVQQAVDGDALDSDYRSAWPAATHVDRVSVGTGAVTVDLSGDLTTRPAGLSDAEARISVQQLVYTVQANTKALPVRFTVDGAPATTLLGVPVSGRVEAAGRDDTLSPISISSPAERSGRRVAVTSPVTVTGEASAFEANVQWELMRGDRVVKHGFTTARECCTLSPYRFTFTAPPGEYQLVVHEEDASGGEGTPSSLDSKNLTIS